MSRQSFLDFLLAVRDDPALRARYDVRDLTRLVFHARNDGYDFTPQDVASLVGALGFFVIPAKRRRAKEEMRRKVAAVREKLSSSLREEFGLEIRKSGDRIRESIGPYSRFVRAEGESLRAIEKELTEATAALAALRSRIDSATGPLSAASATDRPSAHSRQQS